VPAVRVRQYCADCSQHWGDTLHGAQPGVYRRHSDAGGASPIRVSLSQISVPASGGRGGLFVLLSDRWALSTHHFSASPPGLSGPRTPRVLTSSLSRPTAPVQPWGSCPAPSPLENFPLTGRTQLRKFCESLLTAWGVVQR